MRYLFHALIAMIVGLSSAAVAEHGQVELTNTGQPNSIMLIAKNGNGVKMWCPNDSAFKMFDVPPPVNITSAANNGSGLIRLTLAANSRTFHSGERVLVQNVSTPGLLPVDYLATPVDSTHIDLQSSSFTASFTGYVMGAVIGNVNSMRIDNAAAQSMAANATHTAFARWADAACTWAELSLQTCQCATSPPIHGTTPQTAGGFPVDASGDNSTLVGYVMYRNIGGGINTVQGNGSYQLVLTYYNRHWQTLKLTNLGGQTSSTTWAELGAGNATTRVGFLSWSDDYSGQADACFSVEMAVGFVNAQYGYVGIGVNGKKPDGTAGYTATGTATVNQPNGKVSAGWFPDQNWTHSICVNLPINNNIPGGYYELSLWMKIQGGGANTIRSGVVGETSMSVRVQF